MANGSGYDHETNARLPWLESADDDYRDGAPVGRIVLWVLLGLALIAAVVGGFWWLGSHRTGTNGKGELIAAQPGDYKVKPDDPGGMNVEGEGDTVFSTSEGRGATNGSIAVSEVPEAPVDGKKAAAAKAAPGEAHAATKVPASGGPLKAASPTPAHPGGTKPAAAGGGALVQLGSFPDTASAEAAWTKIAKRVSYLAPLGHSVVHAEVNGRAVNRLRVNAGSATQAAELCGKLKVAGEPCFVARD